MSAVAETILNVSPLVKAALLIVARTLLVHFGLSCPKVSEILAVTGAGRSRAYELARVIPEVLAGLVRSPGRPPAPPQQPSSQVMAEVSQKVIAYLYDHPGCVTGRCRRTYTVEYRRFTLELFVERGELDMAAFAQAVAIPLPTLRDWLRGGQLDTAESPRKDVDARDLAATARLETIVNQWNQWKGGFVPFCEHLRKHFRIAYGPTFISSVLQMLGARHPRRRPGRSPDEKAMRGAFETFFPGAQWEGDGSTVIVGIFGHRFAFNLELMVDADTDAMVGISVRDHEDSDSVIEAFDHGVETTGEPPIATELDGRPSNHTDEVEAALGDAMLIPSTPGRPQSNPHVEGAHSLFQNAAPPLFINATTPHAAARQILSLIVTTWARALNFRPRADRGGRSRVDLYREAKPTEEQVHQARRRLRERCRRQQRARETRRARGNPVVRTILDRSFERLGLDDPKGNVRSAIARYPLDHVLNGIAIYEGKAKADTLPPDVDARYLFGIIKNVSNKDEGQLITDALIRLRLEARDFMLEHLTEAKDELLSTITDPNERLWVMLDRAMGAERQLDRIFWLEAAAEAIRHRPEAEHSDMVRRASRRIHATFSVPYEDRLAAVRTLARKVFPLE